MPRVTITGPDGRALPVTYTPLKRRRGWCAVVMLPGDDRLIVVSASVAPSHRLAGRQTP
jgi:hypothetical protein